MLKNELVSNSLRSESVQYLHDKPKERQSYVDNLKEVENVKRVAAIAAVTKLRQGATGGIDLFIDKVQCSAVLCFVSRSLLKVRNRGY